ncbi:prepilin-type N-terminal cleavage/methylation domain-containing protein [Desertibaculum subflavum]|uniref:prepilin-type N-terminal cleavage/methylation domain-containing protein n=1 Tax=Desertibaculum subflavum TaxID=2268458 RepID=UPI000E65F941
MRRHAGFTLVELIAALVAVGLIGAIVAGTLRLGLRSQERLLARSEVMEDRRVVLGQLRRHLEAAGPFWLVGRDGMRVAFRGEARELWFAAEMPGGDGAGGIWLARLASVGGDGGVTLRIDRGVLAEAQGFALSHKVETGAVIDGLQAARFAYSDGGRWLDRWDDPTRLPAKIRLTLASSSGDPWPELIVAPVLRQPRR